MTEGRIQTVREDENGVLYVVRQKAHTIIKKV